MKNIPQLKAKNNLYLSYQFQGLTIAEIKRIDDFINAKKNSANTEQIEYVKNFLKEVSSLEQIKAGRAVSHGLYVPYNLIKSPSKITMLTEDAAKNAKIAKKLRGLGDESVKIIKSLIEKSDKDYHLKMESEHDRLDNEIKEIHEQMETEARKSEGRGMARNVFGFIPSKIQKDLGNRLNAKYQEKMKFFSQALDSDFSFVSKLKNPFKNHNKIFNLLKELNYEEEDILTDDETMSYVVMGEAGDFYQNGSYGGWGEFKKAKLFATEQKATTFAKSQGMDDYAILKIKLTYIKTASKTRDYDNLNKMVAAQERKTIDGLVNIKNKTSNRNKL